MALVAALDFGGRFKSAYQFLHQHGYLPVPLSASRFIRRLHRCEPLIAPLFNDTKALKLYAFDLPEGSTITGDKAYNDYRYEDLLAEAHRWLVPLRRRNSKRAHPPALTYLMSQARHAIETTGSLFERLLPKHSHSVTAAGFELKTAFFILACSLNFLF